MPAGTAVGEVAAALVVPRNGRYCPERRRVLPAPLRRSRRLGSPQPPTTLLTAPTAPADMVDAAARAALVAVATVVPAPP
jgi:hypothetical protein